MEHRQITIREKLLRMLVYQLAHALQFFLDILCSEVCSKIAKFWPKELPCEYCTVGVEWLWWRSRFVKRVITGDETWVYGYDVETKAQSSQYRLSGSLRLQKAHQVLSNLKVMLTVLFDYIGVVHCELLPEGHTINKEYYLEIMHLLCEAIQKNAWNCEKTIHGYCTTIMCQLTCHCLFVIFWPITTL